MKLRFAPLILVASLAFVIFGILAISSEALVRGSIPPGTVLPVALHRSLSTKRTLPGQLVKARIMQDVPLGENGSIPAGSYVQGKVIAVIPAASGSGGRITFEFDHLVMSKSSVAVTISIRALASNLDVISAQIPQYDDRGSSSRANTTHQVGGEIVYRGGGHVMSGGKVVGEPIYDDGVLGRVRENPEGDCEGAIEGNDRPQALWVFSTNACGAYGYRHIRIAHKGRTSPVGEITLASDRDINIRGGAGMLLRVIPPPAPAPDSTRTGE
jgi:hypothetical protein